jgi:predicted ATP-grasp superfamily ATP-dependent carboligase
MQPPDTQISTPAGLPATRRLALYGASVRAAAQSAVRGGFAVTGIDRFGDLDALAACEQHLLLDDKPLGNDGNLTAPAGLASSTEQAIGDIASSMPMIPVGGLLGEMARCITRLSLGPWPGQREAADRARSLDCLRQITLGTAFKVPSYFRLQRNSASTSDRPKRVGKSRWLRKSLDSSGGLGTCWAYHVPSPTTAITDSQYLQRWVPGKSYGATLISNGNDVALMGVCRSRFTRIGRFPFLYSGSLGPIEIRPALRSQLEEIGSRLVANTGIRGLFNFDFIIGPASQCWLLEINPRWSGSSELIERHICRRQPEFSLMSAAVHSLSGGSLGGGSLGGFPRELSARHADDPIYYKRVVFARADLEFDLAAVKSQLRANESLHDIPPDGRPIRRGEPVCTLITQWIPHERRAARQEESPMLRHRALVRLIGGSGGKPESSCRDYSSTPRSSA